MSRPRLSTDDTRNRIISVAEDLFRRLGYGKTAVSDIAAELSMSPANVYRFFASKSAINEAICQRFLADSDEIVRAIAQGPGSAGERLGALIRALHRFNRERYIDEQRVHEMVRVAMEENWQAIDAHLRFLVQTFAGLIAEGIASGEFTPCDVESTAMTVKHACSCLLHPVSISECMSHSRDMDDMCEQMVAFVLKALRAGKA